MEEILASIRRIISDNDKGKAEATTDSGRDDGILDLTERMDPPEPQPRPQPIADDGSEGTPISTSREAVEPTLGAPESESGLVSTVTAAAATRVFGELARALEQGSGNVGDITLASGDTLEDVVKDAVKPMLKEWLDQNLPTLVEDLVRKEIQRMVSRVEDH